MAIVKMNKFTLLTFESFKDCLLKELQVFENVHFRNLQESDLEELEFLRIDSSRELISNYEGELAKLKFIQEKIKPYIKEPGGLKALLTPRNSMTFSEFDTFTNSYNHQIICDEIKVLDEKLKVLKAEKTKLKTENDNLKSWLNLDISMKDVEQQKSIASFIGVISKTPPETFRESFESQFSSSYIEIIGSLKDETAVLVLVPTETSDEAATFMKDIGFSKISLNFQNPPSVQVNVNIERIEEITKEEEAAQNEIAKYEGESKNISVAIDYYMTVLERAKACENFKMLENVIIIDGWVPQEKSASLTEIIKKCCGEDYYLDEQAVEKDSIAVPIKLKNNALVSAFESITSMYSMPKYNEVDPTPLLTPFYMLFFGIMFADIGYGLILLIASLLCMKVFTLGKGTKNFMKFLFVLSICTIAGGFLFGSAFGVTVFKPIPYEGGFKPILDTQMDIVTMIVLSIAIGYIQIMFGLCIKGYMLIRDGKPFSAIFDSFFWILAVTSGICAILGLAGVIPDPGTKVSMCLLICSLVGLALTQGRSSPSIGGKIGNGLYSVYGITSYVGDLVSYTRLVALSLSGAYIATSFNLMASLVAGDLAQSGIVLMVIRAIFAAIVLVFGHALNIGLSVLGGYVHSCRLQYVEYFSKFYDGGGKPFKAFRIMNEFCDIKK